jgi:hypothetical protein
MDESGDLGFSFKKKKTSQYFVVTFIFIKDKSTLEKIIKKVFKGFTEKEIKNHGDDTYYNLIKQKIVEENPLFG